MTCSKIGLFLVRNFSIESRSAIGDGSKCPVIKFETAGPFPADGSNRHNVLTDSAVFRRDIRSNLDGNKIQDGVEFTLNIKVANASNNCEPVAGAAVYL